MGIDAITVDINRFPPVRARCCINCGRCALVCQQLQGVWALEFLNRGDKTRIAPAGGVLLNAKKIIDCNWDANCI